MDSRWSPMKFLRSAFHNRHETKLSSWLPPVESWEGSGLPYGWESAIDKEGKIYYINHTNRTTTNESPVRRRGDGGDDDEEESPREVTLVRDPHNGFGFVAGSEKPVIVRFVTEGGPNEKKLMPGDQILKINGEDVMRSPREHVIELIRSCKQTVNLLVCQPQTNNTTRKSALLTAAKKAKLKNNPSKVRFSEGVTINGSPLFSPSEGNVPFLPNVLKVFLENGQTKSFKYDTTTTVQDVLNSLFEKLSIVCSRHFCLATEHVKITRKNRLTILDPRELLAKIASKPGAHHLRCVLRVAFVPRDAQDLLKKDPVTFEYLYMQCCNDVVEERYMPELKYETALRLTAVHMQQHCLSTGIAPAGKVTVKTVERACGLERFVPASLLESMRGKELRKLLQHFLKACHKIPSPLHAKLYLLRSVSEAPSYGAKAFPTNITDSNPEMTVLVSPRFGISQISSARGTMPVTLCRLEEVTSLEVQKEDEWSCLLHIRTRDSAARQTLSLSMEEKDAEEFVLMLQGYHRLHSGGAELEVLRHTPLHPPPQEDPVPAFHSRHLVHESPWSYPPPSRPPGVRTLDLTTLPPPYMAPSEKYPRSPKPLRSASPSPFDHNMNETVRLRNKTAEGATEQQSRRARRSSVDERHPGVDYRTSIHMELLLDGNGGGDIDVDVHEARNEELIRRLSEVERMVADAHSYLSTSDKPPSPPPHEDDEDEENEEDDEVEIEEDIRRRRSSSAALHHPMMRRDSSFGLHSPDVLHPGPEVCGQNVLDVLRDMREEEEAAERVVCLDPDLIDLTSIPPPATPEVEEAEQVGSGAGQNEAPPPPPVRFFDFAEGTTNGGVTPCLDDSLESLLATLSPPHDDTIQSEDETEVDLSAYIIPPPPTSSPGSNEAQEAVIARFVAAAEDIKSFIGGGADSDLILDSSSSSSSGYDTFPSSLQSEDDSSLSSLGKEAYPNPVVPAHISTSCLEEEVLLSPSSTASSSDSSVVLRQRLEQEMQEELRTTGSCDDLLGSKTDFLSVPDLTMTRSVSWNSLSERVDPEDEDEISTFHPSASLRQNRLRRSFHRPKNGPRTEAPSHNAEEPPINNTSPAPNGTTPNHLLPPAAEAPPLNGRPPINGLNPTHSYEQAIRDIAAVILHLRKAGPKCGTAAPINKETERVKVCAARDVLASESRRFVAASKLFVRQAMDRDKEGAEVPSKAHLSACISLLGRMAAVGEAVAVRLGGGAQLLEGLEAVALAHLRTVEAVRGADPARLMRCATQLAEALTALMRTLRTIC